MYSKKKKNLRNWLLNMENIKAKKSLWIVTTRFSIYPKPTYIFIYCLVEHSQDSSHMTPVPLPLLLAFVSLQFDTKLHKCGVILALQCQRPTWTPKSAQILQVCSWTDYVTMQGTKCCQGSNWGWPQTGVCLNSYIIQPYIHHCLRYFLPSIKILYFRRSYREKCNCLF